MKAYVTKLGAGRGSAHPTGARRTPRGWQCKPCALPRRDRGDCGVNLQYTQRVRTHRQRLEHLVSSRSATAADLQPVLEELRQLADAMPLSAGIWDRLHEQLQSLERALAAASAPGNDAGATEPTPAPSSSSGSGNSSFSSSITSLNTTSRRSSWSDSSSSSSSRSSSASASSSTSAGMQRGHSLGYQPAELPPVDLQHLITAHQLPARLQQQPQVVPAVEAGYPSLAAAAKAKPQLRLVTSLSSPHPPEQQQQRLTAARSAAWPTAPSSLLVASATAAAAPAALASVSAVPAAAPFISKLCVCTGRKCRAQGSFETLEAAQRAAEGSGIEVVVSKCMGKCGQGPCVRSKVAGSEGSMLTKHVDPRSAAAFVRQHVKPSFN